MSYFVDWYFTVTLSMISYDELQIHVHRSFR